MNKDRLREAVDALRAGDNRRARRVLGQVVNDDPDNVAAWWYLSAVLDDPDQKFHCLRRVLELRPDHHEAALLLSKLERRSVMVTPPQGTARPIVDMVVDSAGEVHTAEDAEGEVQREASDATVAVAALAIALAAIILTVILIVTGQAEGILGIRNPNLAPTLPPLGFAVPACARDDDFNPQIVFINNASVSVRVLQGMPDEEFYLLDLEPGAQAAVSATAGVPTRYAVESLPGGYSPGGAILEVPAHSVCRVPIQ